jgi:hypothetical protein
VEQVDLLERTIELDEDQTKTEDDRKVKMTGDVYKLIVECIRGKKPTDFVFTREGGERIVDPRQEWYDLCVSAKLGVDVSAKRRSGKTMTVTSVSIFTTSGAARFGTGFAEASARRLL